MKRNILFILVLISAILSADGLDMKKFKGMKARSIMSVPPLAAFGNPKAAASNGNPFLMIKKPLPLGT